MIDASLSDQGHHVYSAGDNPGRSNGNPTRRSLNSGNTRDEVPRDEVWLKSMDKNLPQDPWRSRGRVDDVHPGDVVADAARITGLAAFAASVVHEVSQPLAGIATNAAICLRVLRRERPDVDAALEAVQRLLRDSNRAADVMRRMCSMVSSEAVCCEPVDLAGIVDEALAISKSELHAHRIIVGCEFPHDLPYVLGDRVQLQQVILNLLQNALDAMATVSNRPRLLAIRAEPTGTGRVNLCVQDAGVGFEINHAERLFEASYTTKSKGMGMGLFVSRCIIERHRGQMWAESNGGPGASFWFSIPCLR